MPTTPGKVSLSPKHLFFLCEALEYRLGWYRDEIAKCTDEDQRGELENDSGVIKSLFDMLKSKSDAWGRFTSASLDDYLKRNKGS